MTQITEIIDGLLSGVTETDISTELKVDLDLVLQLSSIIRLLGISRDETKAD